MTYSATRHTELKQILVGRRDELQSDVQRRIRVGRTDRPMDVGDDIERSDTDIQGEIEFALIQMRTEMLIRIDEALVRLDAGKYGSCFECAGEIAERRLRALPFAVRCQSCEGRREQEQGRARVSAQRRGGFSLFPEVLNS